MPSRDPSAEYATFIESDIDDSTLYSTSSPKSNSIEILSFEQEKEDDYYFEQQSILTPFTDIDLVFPGSEITIVGSSGELVPSSFGFLDEKIATNECFIIGDVPLTVAEKYQRNCHKYLLPPIMSLVKSLKTGYDLDLSSYRPDALNIYFLCQALLGPPVSNIAELDLSNNPFEDEACITLSELMQQSFRLKSLNLANCQIGPKGIQILADGIELSQSIMGLNLSNCNLRDSGGVIVAAAVAENEFLQVLNLSRNNLHVDSADAIQKMLKANSTLMVLNLKWNDLYPEKEASVKIMNGLKKNHGLQILDLSWNGIGGTKFARSLAGVVRHNEVIKSIYLNYNYLTSREVNSMCNAIIKSKSLRELRLGGNSFTMQDYDLLVNAVEKSPTVRNLSLGSHTYLSGDLYDHVLELNRVIQEKDPEDVGITFKDKFLPNPPVPVDFKTIIIDRAKYLAMKPKKKKLRRNMGHFMLILNEQENDLVKTEEFTDLLKTFKARIDEDLVKHFVEEFTEKVKVGKRMRKRVAIKQMAEAYLNRHPTEPPPPVQPKKKRRGKSKGGDAANAKKDKGKK